MDSNYNRYGLLSYQLIANSGITEVYGNIGSVNAITGAGIINQTNYYNTGSNVIPPITNAKNDYHNISNYENDFIIPDADIGGMVFTPGVINFTNSNVTCSSNITLNGRGEYLFKILNSDFSTIPTTGTITMNFLNDANFTHLIWLVSGNVNLQTIGSNKTKFFGTFISNGNITIGQDSTNNCGLIAFNPLSSITLNNNFITATNIIKPTEFRTRNFLNVESTLPDPKAITVLASNTDGGIFVKTGTGGMEFDTTGIISIKSTNNIINIDSTNELNFGNDSTTPQINIGSSLNQKTIIMGNNSTNSILYTRWGDLGHVKTQQDITTLTDADATLTIEQLLLGIIRIPPTVNRTLTLPTASDAVNGINNIQLNDSIDFSIINESTTSNSAFILLSVGSGGSIIGNSLVPPISNLTGSFYTSGSSLYRLRFTNISSGTETYIVYRIA